MQLATSPPKLYQPSEYTELYTKAGLHVASREECDAGRAIAAKLIGSRIASVATVLRVQAIGGAIISVCRDEGAVAGVMGMVPLTPAGLQAVQQNLFDAKNPPSQFLCRKDAPMAAVFGWCLVATTQKAAAMVLLGALSVREHFHDLPFFTRRAATAGEGVVFSGLGYVPYPGAPDGLMWNPSRPSQECAA